MNFPTSSTSAASNKSRSKNRDCHGFSIQESFMAMFRNAFVRLPCRNMIRGLSTAGLGRPDFPKALEQHAAYADTLRACGLAVTILAADDAFPDSVFIEDTAVLSEKAAVITRPGASSRRAVMWIRSAWSRCTSKV